MSKKEQMVVSEMTLYEELRNDFMLILNDALNSAKIHLGEFAQNLVYRSFDKLTNKISTMFN